MKNYKMNIIVLRNSTFRLLLLLFLLSFQLNIYAQQKTVSGVVRTIDGEAAIGATVQEVGTVHGVATDFDGNFTLTVNSDESELQISFVGYRTQTIPVAGRTSF